MTHSNPSKGHPMNLPALPPRARAAVAAAAFAAYVGCVVVANWVTARIGMVPVGFGYTVTAGTYAAGLALLARDFVQDTAGRRAVFTAIVAGAALSAVLASERLALASGAAFLLSEGADMAVYTPLRRHGWGLAAFASGLVGAVADTVLFLWVAGPVALRLPAGMSVWELVPGQFIGKMLWATAVPVAGFSAARWVWARWSVRGEVTA